MKKSVACGVEGTVEVEGPRRGVRIGSTRGKSNVEKSIPWNGEIGAGTETWEGDLRGACWRGRFCASPRVLAII